MTVLDTLDQQRKTLLRKSGTKMNRLYKITNSARSLQNWHKCWESLICLCLPVQRLEIR